MKKYAWMLAALLAGGCAQNEEEYLAAPDGNRITASLEAPAATRSGMNAEGKFVWKKGDAVGVMSSAQLDANICYQLDPAYTDSEQGSFIGGTTQVREGDRYYAYYPYAVNARITQERKLRMTVPAVQTYETASFPTMANPTVSVSDAPDTYAFTNTCGYLRIMLRGEATVTEIVLRAGKLHPDGIGPQQAYLSGSGDVDLTQSSPILVLNEAYGDNSREIKINCGNGVALSPETDTPFIAVVPAGSYRPITVEIRLSTGELYSYVRSGDANAIEVRRNAITTFEKIDITETPLTAVEEVEGVYTVRTPAEWNWIAVQVDLGETFEGKTVRLADDLDFTGLKFIPMGCAADYMTDTNANTNAFAGTLDGNRRTISNVRIDRTNGRGRGIVGQGKGLHVKDLTVEHMTIVGPGKWTAGIVGYANGATLENCHVKNISIDPADPTDREGEYYLAYRIGGLVGLISGAEATITSCSVDGADIKGASVMGGLIGSFQSNAQIEKCSVNLIAIRHTDKRFAEAGHFGSYNPPYYDSAALVGENTATLTVRNTTIGQWEIYDETESDCRLQQQTFTALPYVGELSGSASVDGQALTKGIPTVTTERSILGNGTQISTGASL